jgi:hypothetical protein
MSPGLFGKLCLPPKDCLPDVSIPWAGIENLSEKRKDHNNPQSWRSMTFGEITIIIFKVAFWLGLKWGHK